MKTLKGCLYVVLLIFLVKYLEVTSQKYDAQTKQAYQNLQTTVYDQELVNPDLRKQVQNEHKQQEHSKYEDAFNKPQEQMLEKLQHKQKQLQGTKSIEQLDPDRQQILRQFVSQQMAQDKDGQLINGHQSFIEGERNEEQDHNQQQDQFITNQMFPDAGHQIAIHESEVLQMAKKLQKLAAQERASDKNDKYNLPQLDKLHQEEQLQQVVKDIILQAEYQKSSLQEQIDTLLSTLRDSQRRIPVMIFQVVWISLVMTLMSAIGAMPFFFVKVLSNKWAGICNSVASGVMIATSFDLIFEGQAQHGVFQVMVGVILGGFFIQLSQSFLERYEDLKFESLKGADARKVLLVVVIMTAHAAGEGFGVGVSFCGSKGLIQGLYVATAIGVHNIPEGMAVASMFVQRGLSPTSTLQWTVLSALPQCIVAVPAFAFVSFFKNILPYALGFAAGCMLWIVFNELLPECIEQIPKAQCATLTTISIGIIIWIQDLINQTQDLLRQKQQPSHTINESGAQSPHISFLGSINATIMYTILQQAIIVSACMLVATKVDKFRGYDTTMLMVTMAAQVGSVAYSILESSSLLDLVRRCLITGTGYFLCQLLFENQNSEDFNGESNTKVANNKLYFRLRAIVTNLLVWLALQVVQDVNLLTNLFIKPQMWLSHQLMFHILIHGLTISTVVVTAVVYLSKKIVKSSWRVILCYTGISFALLMLATIFHTSIRSQFYQGLAHVLLQLLMGALFRQTISIWWQQIKTNFKFDQNRSRAVFSVTLLTSLFVLGQYLQKPLLSSQSALQ